MADINDNTKNFIDQLSQGNGVDAGEAFKDALRDKVANALDNASNMFNGNVEAADHSDPKPVVADPGTFNPDGSISPTTTAGQSADGEAQIDLSQGVEDASEPNS